MQFKIAKIIVFLIIMCSVSMCQKSADDAANMILNSAIGTAFDIRGCVVPRKIISANPFEPQYYFIIEEQKNYPLQTFIAYAKKGVVPDDYLGFVNLVHLKIGRRIGTQGQNIPELEILQVGGKQNKLN